MGFSIYCTTSHHCKSWQERQKRDEKLRTVYHPRLVIYVGSFSIPFIHKYPPHPIRLELSQSSWSASDTPNTVFDLPRLLTSYEISSASSLLLIHRCWVRQLFSPASCCQGSEPGELPLGGTALQIVGVFTSESGLNIYL